MYDVGLISRVRRTGPYTVCELSYSTNGQAHVSGLGVAKRHPNDKDNRRIGRNVAYARALRDIAYQIEHKPEAGK